MRFTDPLVERSFQQRGPDYVSFNSMQITAPPYVIAKLATKAPGLDLPAGYDKQTLSQIKYLTGFIEREVKVSGRQAAKLAYIGRQLLALHEDRDSSLKLSYSEKQAIRHLVELVP